MARLAGVDPVSLSDAGCVELLGALEGLKAAAAAAQARVTVAFAAWQREALTAAGVPAAEQGRSIGAQVALARRVSPRQGSRHLGLAQALVAELPETLAALTAGETSEWRATVVARETACLSRTDRTAVDTALAARPGGVAAMGDGQVAAEARRVAYRLDPTSVLRRSARAVGQRCVTLRPAPDAMTWLTALLPVGSGVAAHAALSRAADTARAHGDPRSRGQLMADLLTTRLTQAPAAGSTGVGVGYDPARWDSPAPPVVPRPGGESGHGVPAGTRVEVHLVMTDTTLLNPDSGEGGEGGEGEIAAEVLGYGPVPAAVARRLVGDTDADVWVRRLYTTPTTSRGGLVAMESHAREFPPLLRRFLIIRDEVCRTPWCGAPVRHADHVQPHASGGPTTAGNGQGLCQACNQVKETPGWTARAHPDGVVTTTTATGHTWTSPPRNRWGPPPPEPSQPPDKPDDPGDANPDDANPDDANPDDANPDDANPGEDRIRRALLVTAA